MAKFLDDDAIGNQVQQDVKWAVDYRNQFIEDWRRYWVLWKNYLDEAEYPWDSNLSPPNATTIITVQTAYLLNMVMGQGDFVEVLGKTINGQVSAQAVKELLNYHFRHSFNTFEDQGKFIRQLICIGTSIYKVFWKFQPGWRTYDVPVYENAEEVRTKKEAFPEVLINEPTGYVVDVMNFGVDPNADCIRNARFAFEEMYMDPMDLKEKAQVGIFGKDGNTKVDEVLGHPTEKAIDGLTDRYWEIGLHAWQDSDFIERGRIKLIDYWGYLTKGWTEDRKLKKDAKRQLYHVICAVPSSNAMHAGKYTILLADPTPFRHNRIPYVDARLNETVGEFYGMGDIEIAESLLLEARDHRNIFMDSHKMTTNRMFKARKGSGVTEDALKWRPGGIVWVDEKDDVDVLESGRTDPAFFRASYDLKKDIQFSTGVNDFVVGQFDTSTGFNDTATGITTIQDTALMRIGQKGQVVQRAIRDIAFLTFKMLRQYMPWGTAVRVLDRDSAIKYRFINVSREALENEYDFQIVNAPALGNKNLRIQQLIQLLSLLIQIGEKGGPQPDLSRYVRRVMEEMEIPNPQEIFGFPEFNMALPQLGGRRRIGGAVDSAGRGKPHDAGVEAGGLSETSRESPPPLADSPAGVRSGSPG